MSQLCEHLALIDETNLKTANERVCEECVKTGSRWVHLRTCQSCGTTLCCDSSPNKHATKHYKEKGHPVVISSEPGEKWMWCYEDKEFVEY